MAQERVGGIIQFQIDGDVYKAKGSFSYNLGRPLREAVIGSDGNHGFKETPQTGFTEGEITDGIALDLDKLVTAKNVTVTLSLANGKIIVQNNAYYAGDGTGNTEEGNIAVRFNGEGDEVA